MTNCRLLVFVFVISVFSGCSNPNVDNTGDPNSKSTVVAGVRKDSKQLNVSVLLDLSDRIDLKIHPNKPEHFQRDIEIIRSLNQYFIEDMRQRGAFMAKGKFRVLFSPQPTDPNINTLAHKLNIDLSKMDVKAKKFVYDNIEKDFNSAVSEIYNTTLNKKQWIGSDVWRFFKNDVKDYCIDNTGAYRNVLIVITDGYLYHEQSKDQLKNRYAYILPSLFDQYKLRNNPSWESVINSQDFGLITKRNDLQDLDVLVLEVNPSDKHKNDEDIIKKILGKWFAEMHVKKSEIYNSDLPEYTRKRIYDFLNN